MGWGHVCDRADAGERCREHPRIRCTALVVDEVPGGGGPIAWRHGGDIAGVYVRRTRRSHQLMMRHCDQGEHGQQQREICDSFHICGICGSL
jgi:hypothetical protein